VLKQEHAAKLAVLSRVQEGLREAYVVLEGLRLGVEWELAPPIKTEIARVADKLKAALTTAHASQPEEEQ
jgi:hypothetical protein